jgi:hypothetical protein
LCGHPGSQCHQRSKTINLALPACTATSGNTGTGLKGQYYNNTNLSGSPVLTRYEEVNFSWGSSSPAAAGNADNFSARWSGTVTIPSAGAYTFQTPSDDGIRLWVNGSLVIRQLDRTR